MKYLVSRKENNNNFYCKELLIFCVACSGKSSGVSILFASCLEITFPPAGCKQARSA